MRSEIKLWFFSLNEIIYVWGPKPQKDSWFSSSCTLFRIPWVASNWICLGQKSLVQKLRPAVFLDFIIRSGGIRAFFCSQKVLSISWKGCALAREFMVQTVFSGTPFNGFLTQGHHPTFFSNMTNRLCQLIRTRAKLNDILSDAQSVFCRSGQ